MWESPWITGYLDTSCKKKKLRRVPWASVNANNISGLAGSCPWGSLSCKPWKWVMGKAVGVERILADASRTHSTLLALQGKVDPSLSFRNKVHHNPAVFWDDWRWWEHRSGEWVSRASRQLGWKSKRQTDSQIFFPVGPSGPSAEISRGSRNRESRIKKGWREEEDKGQPRRREDGGGGDKDGGTTLVIGSLDTLGWVDVINGNCTCSREPLMALNLHQAWT